MKSALCTSVILALLFPFSVVNAEPALTTLLRGAGFDRAAGLPPVPELSDFKYKPVWDGTRYVCLDESGESGYNPVSLEGREEGRIFAPCGYLMGIQLDSQDMSLSDLRGADMRQASLRYAFAEGSQLGGALLMGADLRAAVLRVSSLPGALMKGVQAEQADFNSANLHGADLRQADLRNANLGGATLNGADMTGADLSAAFLVGASYDDATRLPFDRTIAARRGMRFVP